MGLFGAKKKSYVDAGTRLTLDLVQSLKLPGWSNGIPEYTEAEIEAIDLTISKFQHQADQELGGKAVFHPDAIRDIQRKLAADGLNELACRAKSILESDDNKKGWEPIASMFLKAWASSLTPMNLIHLGDMFAHLGLNNEARQTFEVVLLLPEYAEKLYGKNVELTDDIVSTAKSSLEKLK